MLAVFTCCMRCTPSCRQAMVLESEPSRMQRKRKVLDRCRRLSGILMTKCCAWCLNRHSPQRLDDLCAGSIKADTLGLTASPAAAYVPPADRYAVVPDHPGAGTGGVGTVPEMPAAKKPRA